MPTIKIGQVIPRTDITIEGKFINYMEVNYFVDDIQYHLKMDAAKFTAKDAEAAIRKAAAEITALQGKELKPEK